MARSPLDSLKGTIARAFRGKLRHGTLRRGTAIGVDGRGDPIPGAPVTHGFDGVRITMSAQWRAAAGIPSTDVVVLVLLGSLEVTPKQGDQIHIEGGWLEVRQVVDVDPAGASMRLACFEIANPGG